MLNKHARTGEMNVIFLSAEGVALESFSLIFFFFIRDWIKLYDLNKNTTSSIALMDTEFLKKVTVNMAVQLKCCVHYFTINSLT